MASDMSSHPKCVAVCLLTENYNSLQEATTCQMQAELNQFWNITGLFDIQTAQMTIGNM